MARATNKLNLISDSTMVAGAKKLYNAVRKNAPYKQIKDAVFISRVEGRGDSRFITVSINMNPATGGAPFARAFDIGSGIHGKFRRKYIITPKRFPLLQFRGTNQFAGKIIRVASVEHPGVKGTGYVKKSVDESRQAIRAEIAKDVKNNLRLYLKTQFENLGK